MNHQKSIDNLVKNSLNKNNSISLTKMNSLKGGKEPGEPCLFVPIYINGKRHWVCG